MRLWLPMRHKLLHVRSPWNFRDAQHTADYSGIPRTILQLDQSVSAEQLHNVYLRLLHWWFGNPSCHWHSRGFG